MRDRSQLSDRALARREQILDAASNCFALQGFHGASIAQISAQAGMSPGHIYHFFENKEAIVVGIVERMLEYWLQLLEPLDSGDIGDAFAERVSLALSERTRPRYTGLWLEVLAETARNPVIARAVHDADSRIRHSTLQLITAIRAARGVDTDTPIENIIEVALALFEGLSNRITINPHFDRSAVEPLLLKTVLAIMDS